MGDLLEEDLEFRGGTLQLSSENLPPENANNQRDKTPNINTNTPSHNVNPSVLSGADSLTSSSSSFAGKKYFSFLRVQQKKKIYILNL